MMGDKIPCDPKCRRMKYPGKTNSKRQHSALEIREQWERRITGERTYSPKSRDPTANTIIKNIPRNPSTFQEEVSSLYFFRI
jgi:hypothetical protein